MTRALEEPGRDSWQLATQVVDALNIQPGYDIADIGAGSGYFTWRLAKSNPEGLVWAVEIEPGLVRYLNAVASENGYSNVISILGTPMNPLLPKPVDLIILVNIFHVLENRIGYLRNLLDLLKPNGKVVVIDYRMGVLPVGPTDAFKIPTDLVEEEFAAAGYSRVRSYDFLPHQYFYVYENASLPDSSVEQSGENIDAL